ncbi:hypothetical protein HMPREF0168_1552 [Bifidobacterium dentium ATCC 27679]|uniref:Uncharacterized protein n=1 Tax=Bifidobacterium dentium ATCC 27679 TaxID=871562 RepID=E0Q8U4_9BIFI|nr:hypothetical protein HMPREF0168_1552 [Bifidobacterium dentium ATCC 27679]
MLLSHIVIGSVPIPISMTMPRINGTCRHEQVPYLHRHRV